MIAKNNSNYINILIVILLLCLVSCADSSNPVKYPHLTGESLTLESMDSINISNKNNYTLQGECKNISGYVEVLLGPLYKTPNCLKGRWNISFDAESLDDGDISILITEGKHYIEEVIRKDTTTPYISLYWDAPIDITLQNLKSYGPALKGSCSEDGIIIEISVKGLKEKFTCSDNKWKAKINLSSIPNGKLTFSILAIDPAGNRSKEVLVTFYKEV